MIQDEARRAVLGHASRARADLQQLTVLMADPVVVANVPDAVKQTAKRAIRDSDDALTTMLEEPGALSTAELWKRMREHQADVDALVSECLTLATGSMLLARQADRGLCAVADRLLKDVTNDLPVSWQAMTVPGMEDRTSYRTGVIGLRCPAQGFWSLPLALHELGHVVAQTLDTRKPGQASHNPVRAVLVQGDSARQREELFADFFATFCLGPAYGAALLLTRFDPEDASPQVVFEDRSTLTATHPSVDKRIHLILETLRRMDASAGMFRHPYRKATQALRSAWCSQATSVGVSADVDAKSVTRLDALAGRFWDLGIGPLRTARHHEPMGVALENYLLEGRTVPPTGTTVRDVVGTAWRLRFGGSDPVGIEERALALF